MKIKVAKSKIHGRGVFTTKTILPGENIETCEIIIFDKKDIKMIDKTIFYNYYFSWGKTSGAIALGNGSLYNHSYNPNAKYVKNIGKKNISFLSLKKIKKGEEVTVNYNGKATSKEKVWFDKK
ncbi:MAG TPA: SET domain-containing protein [Candidatus Paceibacterota bacterium]|nr:SET domain-containing protein [Candidatus Paceibacterota bacterium]